MRIFILRWSFVVLCFVCSFVYIYIIVTFIFCFLFSTSLQIYRRRLTIRVRELDLLQMRENDRALRRNYHRAPLEEVYSKENRGNLSPCFSKIEFLRTIIGGRSPEPGRLFKPRIVTRKVRAKSRLFR